MQKIVFNGHYLMYFDTAVADYWRALALPYEEAMHALGGDLYIKKTTLEYHASARYDDVLDIGMRSIKIGNSSLLMQGAIFSGDTLLNSSELLYVYANPATQTSQRIPDNLRAMLEGYEAGQVMTRVVVGSWAELEKDASSVRTEVFVQEQGIKREDEWDAADATAVHAVVYNQLHQPVATGRLLAYQPGISKIGRMAVKRVLRGGHLGRQVLEALLQKAQARGDKEVLLHAQRSAADFYKRCGFAERGEPFDEVGIPHIEMFKAL
jgi:YbgC/YbaW family acyl-CoA thioester hydrolase